METYKQLTDSMGQELIECSKQKKDKPLHLAKAEELLSAGADVNFKGARPMYFAVKAYNFPFIKLLIRFDCLQNDLSRKYLAGMCERGGFNKKREEGFFDIIDYAIAKTGFDIMYIQPYINVMLLSGQVAKIKLAAEKFSLTMAQVLKEVPQMIIFEAINCGQLESVRLLDTYLNWQEGAIDVATATGQNKVTEYILNRDRQAVPTKESIIRAISLGHTEMLKILDFYGVSLADELYIKAAAECFNAYREPLKFLADKGVLHIGYDGRGVYENALILGNKELLEFVRTLNISVI